MSTVTEIKQAVNKLPPRKKLALAQWLQTQVDDRLSDDEMMAIAVEGARALDKREAAYAKRKAREVWQIDFGLAAKVRPALVLGCDIADEDRVLVAVVYHTTALRGSRYEVPIHVPGLELGGFDAQSIYTVPAVKLIRRRAVLTPIQLKQVEEKVKLWLGLT